MKRQTAHGYADAKTLIWISSGGFEKLYGELWLERSTVDDHCQEPKLRNF